MANQARWTGDETVESGSSAGYETRWGRRFDLLRGTDRDEVVDDEPCACRACAGFDLGVRPGKSCVSTNPATVSRVLAQLGLEFIPLSDSAQSLELMSRSANHRGQSTWSIGDER